MRLYPIWSESKHGPWCTAAKLAEHEAKDEPLDVIAFSGREGCHLCTRLRTLGWEAIAEQLEGGC